MLVEKKKIRAIKGFEANGGRETTKSANCIARKMGAVGAKRGKINVDVEQRRQDNQDTI